MDSLSLVQIAMKSCGEVNWRFSQFLIDLKQEHESHYVMTIFKMPVCLFFFTCNVNGYFKEILWLDKSALLL